MDSKLAVNTLAALAQESRLAVFRWLVQAGDHGGHPGVIAAALELSPATLSFHLRTLLQAGLIDAEPAGRHIRYRANFARMRELLSYLTDNCCGGQPCDIADAACGPCR